MLPYIQLENIVSNRRISNRLIDSVIDVFPAIVPPLAPLKTTKKQRQSDAVFIIERGFFVLALENCRELS